jgi:outer membrane receptor protein involved in Fe transport
VNGPPRAFSVFYTSYGRVTITGQMRFALRAFAALFIATSSPLFLPYSESYASTNIFAMIPVAKGLTMQAGIKNLFDRNYYYTAGYPDEGRNWIVNLRYHF